MSTSAQGVAVREAEAIESKPAPTRKGRLTPEEKQARAAARKIEQERIRLEKAAARAEAKAEAYRQKIEGLEGPKFELPAVVLRDGTVFSTRHEHIQALLTPYMDGLCLDVETTGYQLGHKHYGLRTIQLGGEGLAVVLDADNPADQLVASWALRTATRLHTFSAPADVVPVVNLGLIGWDAIWRKMVDGVVLLKLTDPALGKSHSEGLKATSLAMLGDYSVSTAADKDRAALFAGLKCLSETKVTTPIERSGWAQVRKDCQTMIRYAGSDVLDLAAMVRVLYSAMPVGPDVIERECQAAAVVATAAYAGFGLDLHHIKMKIAEYTARRSMAQHTVEKMTEGAIKNPSSSAKEVLPYLQAKGYVLKNDRKTKQPSAGKASLEPYANRGDMLCKNILEYRHCTTTLGLLLRPLENLCLEGDAMMRPTVYTLEAKTGRMSCVRPNGQQFSRQGGIRQCVHARAMDLKIVNGQWVAA